MDHLKKITEQLAVLAVAAMHKEPEEMTEDEKMAVYIAAGCKVIIGPVPGHTGSMGLRLKHACGMSRVDGRLQVFERKQPLLTR